MSLYAPALIAGNPCDRISLLRQLKRVFASCALYCRVIGKQGLGSRASEFPSLHHVSSRRHMLKTGQGLRGRACGPRTVFATYDIIEGLILRSVMWMTE